MAEESDRSQLPPGWECRYDIRSGRPYVNFLENLRLFRYIMLEEINLSGSIYLLQKANITQSRFTDYSIF